MAIRNRSLVLMDLLQKLLFLNDKFVKKQRSKNSWIFTTSVNKKEIKSQNKRKQSFCLAVSFVFGRLYDKDKSRN